MYWNWQAVWQLFSNLFPWQAFISNTSCAVASIDIACYTGWWEDEGKKKILVTACIAMYKVSWQWTLIILWIIRYHFYLAQEVQAYIQTCNLSPVFSPDRPKEDARKGKILQMWNHLIYDEEYFCEIEARFRQPYYTFDLL